MSTLLRHTMLFASLVSLTACAQVCAPDQVAMGVARLTTLNADAAISGLNDDTRCGFASQAVLDAVVQDGDDGSEGTLTWSVSDCVLDFGAGTDLEPNCATGVYKTVSGKVTIATATKRVSGLLMGYSNSPILPTSDGAVVIEVGETSFEQLRVVLSDSDVSMTWNAGSLSGKLFPRLAKNNSLGACAIQSSHKGFSDVVYTASTATLHSPDQEIEVEIGGSDLKGQFGQNKGRAEDGFVENDISGSIEIWGTPYDIPIEGDSDGLDPDYDSDAFFEQDECIEDIMVPVSFDC